MAARADHRPAARPIQAENGAKIIPDTLFRLPSWTLEEYLAAIADHGLFQSIQDMLKLEPVSGGTSSEATALASQDLVERKFYLAGGNARSLFNLPVRILVEALDEAVTWGSFNVEVLLSGCIHAATTSHALHLLAAHLDDRGRPDFTLVSHLALRMVAVKVGPEASVKVMRACRHDPKMRRAAFEAFVLASVAAGELKYERQSSGGAPGLWGGCDVCFLEPTMKLTTPLYAPTWYVPTQWHPRGYDAVIHEPVDKKNASATRLVFVRMEPPHQPRELDAAPFHELVEKARLECPLASLVSVELWYIVPSPVLQEFTAPITTSEFKSKVVDELSPGTACTVQVVGVHHPVFSTIEHVWRKRTGDSHC